VKKLSRRMVQAGVLIFVAIAIAMPAQAATFSKASLKGSYSFLTNLWTANVATNQFAMVGVLTFDGAGNVTGSYTSISWDTVQNGALGGTYTVNANGTGTLTFTTGSTAGFAITLNSAVAGIAHGVQLLQTNDTSDEIISGTALLQSTTAATYTVASLKGTFAFQYNPRTTNSSLSEDGGVGLFTFDGKGGVKASETIVFGGAIFTGSGTFTYTMSADGLGTMGSTGKGPQFAIALNSVTTAGLAKGLQFLDTNTSDGTGNLVITGSALAQ
jgi:hypothetical protein